MAQPAAHNNNSPLVLAIDIGSSSVRVCLFSSDGRQLSDLRTGLTYDMRTSADGGVEILATSRMAIFKHAWTSESDPASVQSPRDGWTPIARSDHYAAYANCP